jgi:hypothetical protein
MPGSVWQEHICDPECELPSCVQVQHQLQIVLVSDDHLVRSTYTARSVEVHALNRPAAEGMLKKVQADIGKDTVEQLLDASNCSPLLLQVSL